MTYDTLKRIIIVALVAALCALTADAKGDDIVSFDARTYDFGTIKQSDKPVVHDYVVTNTSDVAVAVLGVSTSCGCTRPEFRKKPLEPGESMAITVTFLPGGQKGEIDKDIRVRYRAADSKKSRRTTLKLTGVVVPE